VDTRRITVIGAGGLGGPIALALADAGAAVTVCDPDVVELSNLHRQVQFVDADVGAGKAEALARAIAARGGVARGVAARFEPATAAALAGDAAVVVDGSDDPATKFAVADWARAAGRPYVIAAALRYGGNVFAGAPGHACYRCLFEDAPDEAPSCGDSGVLGPLVGWIGGVAAAAALRLAGGDRAGAGTIWVLDDLRRGGPRELRLARRAGCACAEAA
jgi:adenylyltransferase/sulfurtransferase